tara:strand:- start:33 stop:239 length:207 start_codon:yes stop_codon:yes gene_type:complete
MTTIITGKENIKKVRMMVLRSALQLEINGFRMTRGKTAYSIIKKEYGLKGSRQKVYDQFTKLIESASP